MPPLDDAHIGHACPCTAAPPCRQASLQRRRGSGPRRAPHPPAQTTPMASRSAGGRGRRRAPHPPAQKDAHGPKRQPDPPPPAPRHLANRRAEGRGQQIRQRKGRIRSPPGRIRARRCPGAPPSRDPKCRPALAPEPTTDRNAPAVAFLAGRRASGDMLGRRQGVKEAAGTKDGGAREPPGRLAGATPGGGG
ncbi:translation initiation factor IF-2-like [Panicum virgatum]|uniref:translation initiation factor IF-2-like n=1 Tax=Panicum virgatum TaxID=38727 RepID=UPI0019D64ABD|nr:translation initiation factor IF-2-like [Panicum virgatum]